MSRLLVSGGFRLGILPWMVSLFLTVKSLTLTSVEASEVRRSLDVGLGSIVTTWMSRCS